MKATGESKLNDSPMARYKIVVQWFLAINHEISCLSLVYFLVINTLSYRFVCIPRKFRDSCDSPCYNPSNIFARVSRAVKKI